MCCCGKPTINGTDGYKWNQPDGPTSVYPVNPPALLDGDKLLADEPGRCGGSDSHSHHYRLVKNCGLVLLVRHGGGDERMRLAGPIADTLLNLDSTSRYWLLNAMYHAYSDGGHEARSATASTWRKAAAEKRIKTRKQRGTDRVKVWIEYADVADMRNALVLNQ
jgi:hypothetical protein